QCGGIGWTGATTCPSGWGCTVSNEYYSQCLPGAAPAPTTTAATVGSTGGAAPTSTAAGSGATPTLVAGWSFIRAVEDPNFHKYLRSETANKPGTAVLGDPTTAAQFVIQDGQLIQYANLDSATPLYANVEARANSTVMKLGLTWETTPDPSGTFVWGGDTVEWSSPTISRPQTNAWLVCPDAAGNLVLFINLGNYDYMTPPGCADETIHAYTGPYPTS
ncbi:carbohydrate-binding module family 1 protein, partial [Peniophora sp. CONT]